MTELNGVFDFSNPVHVYSTDKLALACTCKKNSNRQKDRG